MFRTDEDRLGLKDGFRKLLGRGSGCVQQKREDTKIDLESELTLLCANVCNTGQQIVLSLLSMGAKQDIFP